MQPNRNYGENVVPDVGRSFVCQMLAPATGLVADMSAARSVTPWLPCKGSQVSVEFAWPATGTPNGACAIVDDTGRISFFTVGNKTLAEGADQLKIPATDRIRPPLNISCSSAAGGDACVVTDADGHVWLGPTRPGGAFGEPVTRIPVPGLR